MISRRLLLGSAAGLATPLYARAQSRGVELTVQYAIPELFRQLMDEVATGFTRKNPDIRITFRSAEQGYEEILQRNLRDAVTRSLPDVAFHGLNRQRTLLERDIPVDLRPLMQDDAETTAQGYSETLLSLGQVGGKQTGIGFALSTPVLYYNLGLLRRAGGDPEKLPSSWDEVNAMARAIHGSGEGTTGLFFDWTITGNWPWQALLFSHGGRMMNEDETAVAFNDAPGRSAVRVLRSMVDEGRMPDMRAPTMMNEFIAGRLGIIMQSTAQLGRFNREVAGRFPLRTGRFPIPGPNPRLPAGGNVAMMFTKDPAKQQAAWRFIKYATGPEGATMMVNHTGYMPATTIPAEREELLGRFYRENPNHLTAIRQQDVITGWYAFPGQNALKITDVLNDGIQSVVSKRAEADAALDRMAAEVQALLPRRRG
ncbi:ABC transporter substrate-binding protein [Roseomonas harenae]|uniref:ABC transporter substrate-binding protein n=1 Tax=Muricoccus harenae TaxID=2692566 RepID=UPI0013315A0A|nr:ABC transporter substrate-binding protein [Roseomonas harenae]